MELLVNPTSYANALELIALGAHQLAVGTKQFSTRNSCDVNLTEIAQLTKLKKQTKILVLVNRFFFDPQLKDLEEYLESLSHLPIDGIIFSDMAINQICFELKINIPLIYNPETLVTNYDQFPFYLDNKITEVVLARELQQREIAEMGAHKDLMHIQVQVSGYAYVMHSR
jgi:putative protease